VGRHCQGQDEVEIADSLHSETSKGNMGLTHRLPPRRRGPSAWCAWLAAGQGTGSPSSSCLRIISALDGWEHVGDSVLLADTSELF